MGGNSCLVLRAFSLFAALSSSGCAPDDRPLVLVDVDNAPAAATGLFAQGAIDGALFDDDQPFTPSSARIGLRLPSGSSGRLELTLEARGADCVLGRGSGALDIAGPGVYEMRVALAALPACTMDPDPDPDLPDGPPPPPVCVPTADKVQYCWENPLPSGLTYRDTWAGAKDDVWIVGDLGLVYHYDGTRWSLVDSGVTLSLMAVWGSGPTDVWVAGSPVAGSLSKPALLHYDGTRFSPVAGDDTWRVVDLWGSKPSDVWGVGRTSTNTSLIIHYDGTSWTAGTWTGRPNEELTAVWGDAATEQVYVLGVTNTNQDRTLLYWEDGRWKLRSVTEIAPNCPKRAWGTDGKLFVAGTCASGIGYGGRGGVARFTGASWMASDWTYDTLGDGRAAPGGRIVGDSRTVGARYYDYSQVLDVWGSGPTDVWAAGSGLWRFDGSAWRAQDLLLHGHGALRGLTGTAATSVFAVGDYGAALRFDGASWVSPFSSGTRQRWNGIWGSARDDVWAVGDFGAVLHFDGQRWSERATGVPEGTALYGVFGLSRDDVWISGFVGAGASGSGALFRLSGGAWERVALPAASVSGVALHGVWGTSASNLYVVGGDGAVLTLNPDGTPAGRNSSTRAVVLHFDGTSWAVQPNMAGSASLYSIWGGGGEIWAVGADGQFDYPQNASTQNVFMRHTAGSWTLFNGRVPAGKLPLRVVRGTSATDVWAASESEMYHKTDGVFMLVGGARGAALAVTSTNDAWAGDGRGIMRWNGTTWVAEPSLPLPTLTAAWATGSDVWFVGDGGTILHRSMAN